MKSLPWHELIRELSNVGICAFPLRPRSKRPAIESWDAYKERLPTEDEIDEWEATLPADCNVAAVCGGVSRLVVLDADSDDAIAFCKVHGLQSPVQVRTSRGVHYWFRPPLHGQPVAKVGKLFGRADLQLQGEKSYVVAPGSVHETGVVYEWQLPVGLTWDEAIEILPTWRERQIGEEGAFDFDALDLSGVKLATAEEEARAFKLEAGRGYRDGDGRNNVLARYLGRMVAEGARDDLEAAAAAFQAAYFDDPLPDREVARTIKSILDGDRQRHPERHGSTAQPKVDPLTPLPPKVVFSAADVLGMTEEPTPYVMEPFVQVPGIHMVYAYTGAGKSLFVSLLLWHASLGKDFGPFTFCDLGEGTLARTLYIDLEMGRSTIIRRFKDAARSYGDPGDRMQVYAPSMTAADGDMPLDIRTPDGLANLARLINSTRPQIVVLDNIRNLCPGMDEADAASWAPINQVLKRLRNAGLGVIAIHHSNKPQREGGKVHAGSYAGSSNALTVVETAIELQDLQHGQVNLTYPVLDKHTGQFDQVERDAREYLEDMANPDILRTALAVRYDKVRDRDPELHGTQYVGFARRADGTYRIVSTPSNRQRAERMCAAGISIPRISAVLRVSEKTVRQWCQCEEDEADVSGMDLSGMGVPDLASELLNEELGN